MAHAALAVSADKRDRQVARDAERPEPGWAKPIAGEDLRAGTQGTNRVEEVAGEALKQVRIIAARLFGVKASAGPGELKGARHRVVAVIKIGDHERRLPRRRHASEEAQRHLPPGRNHDLPANGEDRIEHRPNRPRKGDDLRQQRRRIPRRTPSPQKNGAIGLVADRLIRRVRD